MCVEVLHSFWASFLKGSINRCISGLLLRVVSGQSRVRGRSNLLSVRPPVTVRITDSSGLTAAACASLLSDTPWICRQAPGCGEKCSALLSRSALGKRFVIQVDGSAQVRAVDTFLDGFSNEELDLKRIFSNVDSRMQEADEQSEGKKKEKRKRKTTERRRRVGALLERGRERWFGLFSGCLLNPSDYMLRVLSAAASMFFQLIFLQRLCINI